MFSFDNRKRKLFMKYGLYILFKVPTGPVFSNVPGQTVSGHRRNRKTTAHRPDHDLHV